MSTLWVFGDSFAENHVHSYVNGRDYILEQQWHRVVAYELGFDYQNFGLGGSSLDYTYYEWHCNRKSISPGDLVIAVTTGLDRRWLIKDQPRVYTIPYTFYNRFDNTILDRKTIKSIDYYYRYLDHGSVVEANLYNWLCSINHVAANKIKVLILPVFSNTFDLYKTWCFDFSHISFANGTLQNINYKEHDHQMVQQKQIDIVSDGRCNHLSIPNHKVLADKILAWYQRDQTVDLFDGFFQDIIKDEISDEPRWFIRQHEIKII